jgi:ribosome-associated protein
MNSLIERGLEQEFIFQASRSGGAGGQNVNKVATKVELKLHINSSQVLRDDEKELIHEKLGARINNDGYLQIICQTERTQLRNKEQCIERLYKLLRMAFTRQKKRKETKPTKASVRKRLESKKKQSERKAGRNYLRNN